MDHTTESFGFKPGAESFPEMCVVVFTYVCNAKCPSCVYTNSEIRSDYKSDQMMSEEVYKIIADQVAQRGSWLRISGGGEPMLHPQAVELFEYAKSKGAKVGLITNGSRFDEDSINRLLEAQIDMIEFSVDAAEKETYSKVREGLDWDRLLETIKQIVDTRNRINSSTRIIASGVDQVDVDIDKVAQFWEPKVDVFQKRKYLTWGINKVDKSANKTPYLPLEDHIPCPFPFDRMLIDSRGRVMACPFDVAGKTNMGNVKDRSISEIWQGEGFDYYRQMHLARKGHEIELCSGCTDWQYRSWKYNYFNIVKSAKQTREEPA